MYVPLQVGVFFLLLFSFRLPSPALLESVLINFSHLRFFFMSQAPLRMYELHARQKEEDRLRIFI